MLFKTSSQLELGVANCTEYNSLLKKRNGLVLARNIMLKNDHFTREYKRLEQRLIGAPNFRQTNHQIFGTAQPSITGFHTILHYLQALSSNATFNDTGVISGNSNSVDEGTVWISMREEPFVYINEKSYVIRDVDFPLQNIKAYTGVNASRLESIEEKLVEDIKKEAASLNGLLLVHVEDDHGCIVPSLVATDQVKTPREVFEALQLDHSTHPLIYHRIPVSSSQYPSEEYVDKFIEIISSLNLHQNIVFSCGMGVGRTTIGMIIAYISRVYLGKSASICNQLPVSSKPLEKEGKFFPNTAPASPSWSVLSHALSPLGRLYSNSPMFDDAYQNITMNTNKNYYDGNKSILRLINILEKGFLTPDGISKFPIVEWALERPDVVDSLESGLKGNYSVILDLCRVLENGMVAKRVLDEAIDNCDAVLNLRENILYQRIRHSVYPDGGQPIINALYGLGRYFTLLAFSSYILEVNERIRQRQASDRFVLEISNQSDATGNNNIGNFSEWMRERDEIWGMFDMIKSKGPSLESFHPVADLTKLISNFQMQSSFSSSNSHQILNSNICNSNLNFSLVPSIPFISQPLSINKELELAQLVLKRRWGSVLTQNMIIKFDAYNHPATHSPTTLNSSLVKAFNFRRVGNICGMSQPNMLFIKSTVEMKENIDNENEMISSKMKKVWINLREEPIIYLDGFPYVLRDQTASARNVKSYAGISSARIERMESRLKMDVLMEAKWYEGRLLVHKETEDGLVIPYWEQIEQVVTTREIYESLSSVSSGKQEDYNVAPISYYRVPITAEEAPELADFDELFEIVEKEGPFVQYILNCQLGRGRSTIGMIIVQQCVDFVSGSRDSRIPKAPIPFYKSILSLTRLISNGLEIKERVDYLVEHYSHELSIPVAIEEATKIAQNSSNINEVPPAKFISKGIKYLKRYFLLFAFEAYLDSLSTTDQIINKSSDDIQHSHLHKRLSFKTWFSSHLELTKLLAELSHSCSIETLIPQALMKVDESVSGNSLEIIQVINERNGSVLAHRMILKHDHFLGCQKISLTERVEGAPNYRRIPLSFSNKGLGYSVCGIGMPKKEAIYSTVERLLSSTDSVCHLLWISFREEPVLFVKGEPYVLRFFQEPVTNIESTGIIRDRVESIEQRLKSDVLKELMLHQGKILVHEEQVGGTSLGFSIVPVWITALPADIQTPKEIYSEVATKHSNLTYVRIPITDEQAPLPAVFDELYELMHLYDSSQQLITDVIFNCQMGRGRTTTGMVIATIVEMSRDIDHFIGLINIDEPTYDVEEAGNEEKRLRSGEYKIILQLLPCLDHGKRSKLVADKAIDLCHHMQNLREAIYTEFKLKLDLQQQQQQQQQQHKYETMRERGLNYLMRYFYLIVFADYALSKSVCTKEKTPIKLDADAINKIKFSEWLCERKEIYYLYQNRHDLVIEF